MSNESKSEMLKKNGRNKAGMKWTDQRSGSSRFSPMNE